MFILMSKRKIPVRKRLSLKGQHGKKKSGCPIVVEGIICLGWLIGYDDYDGYDGYVDYIV